MSKTGGGVIVRRGCADDEPGARGVRGVTPGRRRFQVGYDAYVEGRACPSGSIEHEGWLTAQWHAEQAKGAK